MPLAALLGGDYVEHIPESPSIYKVNAQYVLSIYGSSTLDEVLTPVVTPDGLVLTPVELEPAIESLWRLLALDDKILVIYC